jgi:hypothetical protein
VRVTVLNRNFVCFGIILAEDAPYRRMWRLDSEPIVGNPESQQVGFGPALSPTNT